MRCLRLLSIVSVSLVSGSVVSVAAGQNEAVDGSVPNVTAKVLNNDDYIEGFARVDGLVFGGISGIDYDQQSKFWYVVSNDTGDTAPVRFFAMDIQIDEYGNIFFISDEVQRLNHPDGEIYEPGHHSPGAVRIIPPDPIGDEPYLIWTSEGVLNKGYKAGVFQMCTGATFMDGFVTSPHLDYVENKQGPRNAKALESLALLPNMEIIAGYEQALTQDGPPSTPDAGTTYTRLVHLDYFKADQLGEMAYALEAPDAKYGEKAERSLVELVAVNNDTLVAVESITMPESTSRQHQARTELYLVELTGASDISELESLKGLDAGNDFVPVKKTFIGDNDTLGGLRELPYKAATFGPMIDDERASLVMLSDNGLNQYMPTYVAYIEMTGVQPRRPYVKEDAKSYGQYEERDLTTEQGTPQRFRITREMKAKMGEEVKELGSN